MLLHESIYFSSPIFLQNILVSLYGYKLYRERYGDNASKYNKKLEESESFNFEKMYKLQEENFLKVVHHAINTVPYYQDWAFNNHIAVGDFNSLNDLLHLPILEKEEIRKDPSRFLSSIYRGRRDLFTLNTSGTSGKPLTIYCDSNSRTHHYAFFTRLRNWFDLNQDSRRITLFGRIILRPEQDNPPFWRYDFFQKNLLMSSYHLSEKNLPFYIKKINSYLPDEIIGYPSSIYQLAKYIVKHELSPLTLKVVITTGETLLPHQRMLIEKAFSCPVIDQYGCVEMAFFASQCQYGSMHLHPEHGIMEVTDFSGQRVLAGESGVAVTTGLINFAMPLLRYKVGDIISISDKVCACKRAFPILERIEGRMDDILTTPDGRPLGRLGPLMRGRKGIYETQIIQRALDRLEFKIVRDDSFDDFEQKCFLYEIRKRVGPEMKIDFTFVNSIEKNNNGKFKTVIRNIPLNND